MSILKLLALGVGALTLFVVAWSFRYVPVESPIPSVRIVWDRIGHRYCYSTLIPPKGARVTFEQAWEAQGSSWSVSPLRCD